MTGTQDDAIAELQRANAELQRKFQASRAERDAALAEKAALAEVVDVINRSPGNPGPVFDAILEKAHTLCRATTNTLQLYDGEGFRAVAVRGLPAHIEARLRAGNVATATVLQPLIEGQNVIQMADAAQAGGGAARIAAELGGTIAYLAVALRAEGRLLGAIVATRRDLGPFSEREFALLESFAAQAVIAMENARLITEQREALEQQTATAEVLQVINASPGDLVPVFDAILEKAHVLCGAAQGSLQIYDGEQFRALAVRGMSEELEATLRRGFRVPMDAAISADRVTHITDLTDVVAQHPDDPVIRAGAEIGQARTLLSVPLNKEGVLVGRIVAARLEVRPFTDKQITLLQNFAAQAVIAIENARLINEQREALEQQTATAEVLQVINASPGDLAPVFDAILQKAHTLCGAAVGTLATFDGEYFRAVATHGYGEQTSSLVRRGFPPESLHRALIRGERLIHVPDVKTYPLEAGDVNSRAWLETTDFRTSLMVPLRKDSNLVGFISSYRREVRSFSEKEIALLENFAAQAVIAMENARLITEQREALEQQTATAEVLRVINASPGDLEPVFEAIVEKAHALCDAAFGSLQLWDGELFRGFAMRGFSEPMMERLRQGYSPWPNMPCLRIVEGERVVHCADLAEIDDPTARVGVALGGVRTILYVALRKDDVLLGQIVAARQEVRPFSEKEIALVESFAAQAEIAMENARLITEQREALEQQTATAEVLQVINASPGNLQPVFDAMLENAMRLCGAAFGELYTFDGENFKPGANQGIPVAFADFRMRVPLANAPGSMTRRILDGASVVHIADVKDDELYRIGEPTRVSLVDIGGARTVLAVALRKYEFLLGFIVIYRQEVRPFSDRQVALLENFAAQAVIAMENARLINEQREALEQQTATTEVLQVINASPGNLAPVFDAMLEKAMRLCGAAFGALTTWDGEYAQVVATRGFPPALAAYFAKRGERTPNSPVIAQLSETKRPQQLPDVMAGEGYRNHHPDSRATFDLGGARTMLHVPLVKDETMLGYITIYRQEVRVFSDAEIALLESFAAQAVIAMENARLLNELRTRTDELAQRQAELRVTFENMGGGVAMFDETSRLIAWNSKFQEFFNVPDGLLAEHRTYAEYIRFLAERGDYGADADVDATIRQIAAMTGVHRTYERVRPDGRVIEVRNNPVTGGGFVLMFSDITERKRNEAEIAAARDAAQEATRTIEAAFRELKTAQANLVQAEKMASLGQLTAGIAHEIKNPLNFVNNFAELSVDLLGELKDAIAPAEAALNQDQRDEVDEVVATLTSNLEKITEHGKRADRIVKAMLEHSRGASGERREVDINALADEALNLAYHGARAQDQNFNIALERDFAKDITPIEVNPQDLTRVFLNLFSNGFYAASKRAKSGIEEEFTPTLKVTTRDLGDTVEIRVRDNGAGIPTDIRDKLFQPFFTTKPSGQGAGLGLSITYDIVTKAHGGTITVDSEIDEFTEFVVALPRRMFTTEGGRA